VMSSFRERIFRRGDFDPVVPPRVVASAAKQSASSEIGRLPRYARNDMWRRHFGAIVRELR